MLSRPSSTPRKSPPAPRGRARGIVLVVSLVMLVIISLLAALSVRNAASTERVSGAVRTMELATQAAEIALRHCEQSVIDVLRVARGGTSAYSTTFPLSQILPVSSTPQWQSMTIWDSKSTSTFVLPLDLMNQSGMTYSTFKRPPECMVEPLPVVLDGATAATSTASFVITARGFGPEVPAADESRSRPIGTEVWLQSRISIE